MTFDSTAADESLVAVWRLDLSAEPESASRELQDHHAAIQAMAEALDSMPDRLEMLMAQRTTVTDGISYASGEAVPTSAEAALLEQLREIDFAGQTVSFAVGEAPLVAWSSVYEQFQNTVVKLLRAVTHMAWVETSLEGRLLGRTTVSWSGSTETQYSAEISLESAALHQRSLEVAVTSRNLLLRSYFLSIAGAAKLSALLATPGGALLALPAVWQYITQVLAQVEQYQRLSSSPAPE